MNTEELFASIDNEIEAIETFIDGIYQNVTPMQGGALTITIAGNAIEKAALSQGWSLEFTQKFIEEAVWPHVEARRKGRMQ